MRLDIAALVNPACLCGRSSCTRGSRAFLPVAYSPGTLFRSFRRETGGRVTANGGIVKIHNDLFRV